MNEALATTKRMLFYWSTSFGAAVLLYYILLLVLPFPVFGVCFRMYTYHLAHPIPFIAIPCFFYGLISAVLSNYYARQSFKTQLLLTGIIIAATIVMSLPFGGMLWYWFDMKAGFYPADWMWILVKNGFLMGFSMGWFIILLSVPYNIIGATICFLLTRKGAQLWRTTINE